MEVVKFLWFHNHLLFRVCLVLYLWCGSYLQRFHFTEGRFINTSQVHDQHLPRLYMAKVVFVPAFHEPELSGAVQLLRNALGGGGGVGQVWHFVTGGRGGVGRALRNAQNNIYV